MGRRGLHNDGSRVHDGPSRRQGGDRLRHRPLVHADLPCIGRADARMGGTRLRPLRVCGLNAVRSPMAGLARRLFGKSIYIRSAGVERGELDPFSVKVMEGGVGLDIGRHHRPRTVEEIEDDNFVRPDHHAGAGSPPQGPRHDPDARRRRRILLADPDPTIGDRLTRSDHGDLSFTVRDGLEAHPLPGSTGNLRDGRIDHRSPLARRLALAAPTPRRARPPRRPTRRWRRSSSVTAQRGAGNRHSAGLSYRGLARALALPVIARARPRRRLRPRPVRPPSPTAASFHVRRSPPSSRRRSRYGLPVDAFGWNDVRASCAALTKSPRSPTRPGSWYWGRGDRLISGS